MSSSGQTTFNERRILIDILAISQSNTNNIKNLTEVIRLSITETGAALAQATATINIQNETLTTVLAELQNVKTIVTDLQSSSVDPDTALAGALQSLNTAITAGEQLTSNVQAAVDAIPGADTAPTLPVAAVDAIPGADTAPSIPEAGTAPQTDTPA